MSLKDLPISLTQIAYGLLWRSPSTDHYVFVARQWMLDNLTKQEQHDAIAWVIKEYGDMKKAELISADIRCGIFPHKGYARGEDQQP